MKTLARHKITYLDNRNGRTYSRILVLTDETPAGAYRAIVPTLGKPKDIELLTFDGVPCESPQAGEEVVPQEEAGITIPSAEQIREANHKDLTQIVQFLRAESRVHRDYFNLVRLNIKTEVLQAVLLARLHPADGEAPAENPEDVIAALKSED